MVKYSFGLFVGYDAWRPDNIGDREGSVRMALRYCGQQLRSVSGDRRLQRLGVGVRRQRREARSTVWIVGNARQQLPESVPRDRRHERQHPGR